MNKNVLIFAKECIKNDDREQLEHMIENVNTQDYQINYSYIFNQLLYYSCINNKKWCIEFLLNIYNKKFDEVEKIALRQSFVYGKYLCRNKEYKCWYQNLIKHLVEKK